MKNFKLIHFGKTLKNKQSHTKCCIGYYLNMRSRAYKHFIRLSSDIKQLEAFSCSLKTQQTRPITIQERTSHTECRYTVCTLCFGKSPATGVLTIYLGKSNILVGKSKLMAHAIPFGWLQKHQFFSSF